MYSLLSFGLAVSFLLLAQRAAADDPMRQGFRAIAALCAVLAVSQALPLESGSTARALIVIPLNLGVGLWALRTYVRAMRQRDAQPWRSNGTVGGTQRAQSPGTPG